MTPRKTRTPTATTKCTTARTVAALLAALVVGTTGVSRAAVSPGAGAEAGCDIVVRDGQLSAYIAATSLRQVLAQLTALTGAETHVAPSAADQLISVQVDRLPLREAVRVILRGSNASVVSTGEHVAQIWVLGHAKRHTAQEQADDPAPFEAESAPMLAAPAEDMMPRALELDVATVDMLATTALNAADPAERIQAMAALATHAGGDARVQEVLAEAANDSDPQVHEAALELANMQ